MISVRPGCPITNLPQTNLVGRFGFVASCFRKYGIFCCFSNDGAAGFLWKMSAGIKLCTNSFTSSLPEFSVISGKKHEKSLFYLKNIFCEIYYQKL